jgi:hypothetical protein
MIHGHHADHGPKDLSPTFREACDSVMRPVSCGADGNAFVVSGVAKRVTKRVPIIVHLPFGGNLQGDVLDAGNWRCHSRREESRLDGEPKQDGVIFRYDGFDEHAESGSRGSTRRTDAQNTASVHGLTSMGVMGCPPLRRARDR